MTGRQSRDTLLREPLFPQRAIVRELQKVLLAIA
jgi:hypothetical protein